MIVDERKKKYADIPIGGYFESGPTFFKKLSDEPGPKNCWNLTDEQYHQADPASEQLLTVVEGVLHILP